MQKSKYYKPNITMTEWMAQWQSITFHLRSLKNEKLNNMPIVPDKPNITMTEWMAEWQSITFYLRSLKNEKLNNMPIVPDITSIEYDYYKRDQRRKSGLL